jgi:hypothetical protein
MRVTSAGADSRQIADMALLRAPGLHDAAVRRVRRALALGALLSVPPAVLRAQAVSVVVNSAFRPTAVLGPHVRYVIGADSAGGGLRIEGLAVPPVVIGSLRIEGVDPGAAPGAAPAFDDTVRFEPDGRTVLLRADRRGGPPITVEVVGARGAAGARIVMTAQHWPLRRAILVTLSPADLHELSYGTVGFGVRDRIRVDDRSGIAYLTDSTAGPTTVAVGLGAGTAGHFQAEIASVVLRRDFGGEEGQERRLVAALTVVITPQRGAEDDIRADLVFGVGDGEAAAAAAARVAGSEPAGAPLPWRLQAHTPADEVSVVLQHTLAAAGWALDWDLFGGQRTLPASARRPVVRVAEAWRAAPVAVQRGDTAAVCGSYRVLRGGTTPAAGPHAEVARRLGPDGRYLGAVDSLARGDDAGLILLAYACYRAERVPSFLDAEMPALVAASTRASADPADPLLPPALRALAELDDEAVRLAAGARAPAGDSLRALAAAVEPPQPDATPQRAWQLVRETASRALARDYARIAWPGGPGGLSLPAAGMFLDALARGLFGIEEHLDRVDIVPRLNGLADTQTWSLDGWLIGSGDTLGLSYRANDRAAHIRLAASRRWRLGLRFPWLTATSCVTARRAGETERPMLVMLLDGTGYVDVRATFDAAEITVTADACR